MAKPPESDSSPAAEQPSKFSVGTDAVIPQIRTEASPVAHTNVSQWRPDVYAHKFIPEAMSAINSAPARSISIAPSIGVDYNHYISTFAGSGFLRAIEVLPYYMFSGRASVASLDQLEPQNYGQYFGDCLTLELQAQVPESRCYYLYAVTLEQLDASKQLYSLRVPGLRDGTPSVSLGDFLTLRQLIIDPLTRLPRGMQAWLTSGARERGEMAPGFTGFQVRAVISGTDKLQELVILNAAGIESMLPPVCNVMFEPQPRVMHSLHRAVADVASALFRKENRITSAAVRKVRGVDKHDWLHRMLFPVDAHGIQQETLPSAVFPQTWFDKVLNFEQQKAVNAVQHRTYGDMCYLIHGPPGTGKTKTICEIILQLGKDLTFRGSILLCAASNTAADILALRLRHFFEPGVLLRLNELSRTFAEVPQELLPYCWVEQDMFNLPPFPKLMAYKIIIVTCQGADALVQARVTNGDLISLQANMARAMDSEFDTTDEPAQLHWAALIIDEAAQATEPETLIPLTVVAPPPNRLCTISPIIVMAGDQHQLSARTYSKETTLRVSLFERLADAPVYATHPLARKNLHRREQQVPMIRPPFVNLIRNYRSHPAILSLPSSLFYSNTLIPEATQTDSLQTWTGWQGRRWPVLFSCNRGLDDCEDVQSPGGGWFNIQEAQKAIDYAKQLLSEKLISDQAEICIMSPFHAQVRFLRQHARGAGLQRVNIGPMEAFQGLESRFVIICTTRTRKRFLDDDELKGVGLVNQKKKFNVALTRAKEGLVVIGNPWVLATDPYWLAFLRFCHRNSLWQDNSLKYVPPHSKAVDVNDWRASHGEDDNFEITGLEAALLYKERDKTAGSQAAKRFMSGSESQEDAMWRAGLEAEQRMKAKEALEIADWTLFEQGQVMLGSE